MSIFEYIEEKMQIKWKGLYNWLRDVKKFLVEMWFPIWICCVVIVFFSSFYVPKFKYYSLTGLFLIYAAIRLYKTYQDYLAWKRNQWWLNKYREDWEEEK